MSSSTLEVPITVLQEQEMAFAQIERDKQARSVTTLATEPEDYDGLSMSQSEASLRLLQTPAAGPSMPAQTHSQSLSQLSHQSASQVDDILRQQDKLWKECREQRPQPTAPLSPKRTTHISYLPTSYDDFKTPYDDAIAHSSSTEHQENLNIRDYDIDQAIALSKALAASQAQPSHQMPPPPETDTNTSTEVDVDDIIVRKVQQSNAKVGRNNRDPDSYEEHIVGAWDIQNAGDRPTAHPSDTQPPRTSQSARFRTQQPQAELQRSASAPACQVQVPPTVFRQQNSDTSQSEITQSMSLSTTTPRNNNSYNGNSNNMPVANPVSEEPDAPPLPATLVTGTNVQITGPPDLDVEEGTNKDQEKQKQPPPTEQRTTLAYFLGGGGCVATMLLIFVLLCLFVESMDFMGIYQGKDKDDTSNTVPSLPPAATMPAHPPTTGPTSAPTPHVIDLPEATMAVVRADPQSPQAKAYRWLIADIQSHPKRPRERQLQRFALATLFYATIRQGSGSAGNSGEVENLNGVPWKRSKGWLDHDVDECEWETAASTGRDLPTPYRICDDVTGLYESLVLDDNGLEGYIPPELSLLTTLQFLDLGQNNLKYCDQCIPSELGLLTNLDHFNFYFSYGKGTVPSELGQWTSLKTMSIERNRFLGTIPTQLGMLTNLEKFHFQRNNLSGTLPAELGSLLANELWELNVEHNDLTGAIPESFDDAMEVRKRRHGETVESYGKLLKVSFRGNLFTGTVPEEMCSLQRQLDFDCEPTGNTEEGLCGCTCECAAATAEEKISSNNPDNSDLP